MERAKGLTACDLPTASPTTSLTLHETVREKLEH